MGGLIIVIIAGLVYFILGIIFFVKSKKDENVIIPDSDPEQCNKCLRRFIDCIENSHKAIIWLIATIAMLYCYIVLSVLKF